MRAGEIYENPVTGESVVVIEGSEDTGGAYLLGELTVSPGGHPAMEHIHDELEEAFEVVSGRIKVRLDGRDFELGKGESAHVARGVAHYWWNAADEDAVVRVRIEPPSRFEEMISTVFALGRAGRTNAQGMPGLLQLSLFATEFQSVLRVTKPPRIVQRVLFAILAPIARRRGLTGTFPYGEPGHVDLADRAEALAV
jgi:quercetin dioxygenase-like cupin family protein